MNNGHLQYKKINCATYIISSQPGRIRYRRLAATTPQKGINMHSDGDREEDPTSKLLSTDSSVQQ